MAESFLEQVEGEILGGLQNERDRMKDSYDNLRFSQARFEEYPTRYADDNYDRTDAYRRTSPIFQRVVEVLTANLYRASPTRRLPDTGSTDWLERVYKKNAMAPKWKRADELAVIGNFAAFQFAGDTDPQAPVKINLWGAEQLVVWTDPEEATRPLAVATVDMHDQTRRLSLWSEEHTVRFVTPKGASPNPGDGSNAYQEVPGSRKVNPYRDINGKGILPFSFVHFRFPTQEFDSGGPGNGLRELNDHVNFRLDNLGDSVRYLGKPIGVAEGVNEGWVPPTEVKPGTFLKLPPAIDAGGNGVVPTLRFISAEMGFVAADWADLNNYLDHLLEMNGIPPASIRMVQSGARSGFSLLVEQAPLLAWVEGRRPSWAVYEERAVAKALEVGRSHLAANKRTVTGFDKSTGELKLALKWPPLYVQLPGPERDQADEWRLGMSLTSKIQLLMEREDLTRDQAIERLKQIKDDNDELQGMGIEPGPPAKGGMVPADGSLDQQGQPTDGSDQLNPDATNDQSRTEV